MDNNTLQNPEAKAPAVSLTPEDLLRRMDAVRAEMQSLPDAIRTVDALPEDAEAGISESTPEPTAAPAAEVPVCSEEPAWTPEPVWTEEPVWTPEQTTETVPELTPEQIQQLTPEQIQELLPAEEQPVQPEGGENGETG